MLRAESDIFAELSDLCVSPGFIHAISYICLRDNIIKFSGEMTTDDMSSLYGRERLIRNEVNVLIGLLIKKAIGFTNPGGDELKRYVARAHELLEEIHYAMLAPVAPLTPGDLTALGATLTSGAVMRESIFYGGESAYVFQYRDFAPERYAQDDSWIVANKGFSMREAASVVKAVGALRNEKCTTAFHAEEADFAPAFDSLPSFEFTIAEISALAGIAQETVGRILSAFAVPEEERNAGFTAVDAPNAAAITPLLRRGESFILFNIFDLSEVLYQAPYFWMLGDRAYQPSASKHRGEFTENFAQSRLALVFGAKNVRTNVNIVRARTVVGEIDVLLIFGDVAIVVQAKSKQLTALARRGNEAKLKSDFEAAVQDACDQGYATGDFLFDSTLVLQDSAGATLEFPDGIRKVFVLCLIADHYPSLAYQARQFLRFTPNERLSAPLVMDVFLLDAMVEMLDSPLRFLNYVERRTGYNDVLMSSHELNILAFHLRHNLWVESKYDRMYLEDDVGTSLELSMLVRRENVPGPWTPPGILTRMSGTRLGDVIKQIEKNPNPAMIALGELLLRMGEDSFIGIGKAVDELMRRGRMDDLPHDVTVMLKGEAEGLTIHVSWEDLEIAQRNLIGYCEMRKYAQRSDSWFGIVLDPLDGSIRFGVHAKSRWKQDSQLDELTKKMQRSSPAGELQRLAAGPKKKMGRNDRCDCGSGKKSKRCCYA